MSVHDSRSLQTATNVPVLASIPAIMLESDFVARRRRQVREALVAASVVIFCLAGGAATYVYVNDIELFSIESNDALPENEGDQAMLGRTPGAVPGVAGSHLGLVLETEIRSSDVL